MRARFLLEGLGVTDVVESSRSGCISRLRFLPGDLTVMVMEDSSSSSSDGSSERMEQLSSCRTGCAIEVDWPTRIVAPALACSRGLGILAPRLRRSLEMRGLMRGWTMMVSSSTDVASVAVASLLEEGVGLSCSDSDLEVVGDGLSIGASVVGRATSISSCFTMGAFLAFFGAGEGLRSSNSCFRFKGVRLGSTDGDFPSDDPSAFLYLENDRGVLLDTFGLMLTSGVSDWSRDKGEDPSLLLRRNEYPSHGTSMESLGTAWVSILSSAVHPFWQRSSQVLQRHSQLSSPK